MKVSQTNVFYLGCAVAGIVVLYGLVGNYSIGKGSVLDTLEQGGRGPQGPLSNDPSLPGQSAMANNPYVTGADLKQSEGDRNAAPSGPAGNSLLSPSELLPKGTLGASWAATNPVGMGDLKGQNFLQPGWHYGINTVGQTLRNANLDLRSDPPNPRTSVSPFLNSTIEPDTFRRPLEIGEGPQ